MRSSLQKLVEGKVVINTMFGSFPKLRVPMGKVGICVSLQGLLPSFSELSVCFLLDPSRPLCPPPLLLSLSLPPLPFLSFSFSLWVCLSVSLSMGILGGNPCIMLKSLSLRSSPKSTKGNIKRGVAFGEGILCMKRWIRFFSSVSSLCVCVCVGGTPPCMHVFVRMLPFKRAKWGAIIDNTNGISK